MIDMIQLGSIKAGLVKVIYCGKVVGTGLVNTDGTFSNGSNMFKSPSGFALYMVQQVNPKIRAINGYTSIFQGNNSLDHPPLTQARRQDYYLSFF